MKLSPRQVCFFLAAAAPIGKLVLLPARLAAACGNDLLFPVLAQLLVQAALIFCILLLARRQRSLYALLRAAFGAPAAAALCALCAAFLLFAAFLPVVEQKLFVRSIFYDTIPAYLVFTPFFLFSAYLCTRSLGTLGRIWDILAPLTAAGLVGIALLSAGNADFGALRPAGSAGLTAFAEGTATACSWFFDAALLLPLMGHIDYKKGLAWKGTLCYLGGGAVLLFLLAEFYGVFAEIAPLQTHAFARMSAFFPGIAVLGRIDYLFIFAVAFALTFYVILPMQGAVGLVTEAFGGKKFLPALLSVAFNIAMLAAVYLTNFRTAQTIDALTGTLFWIYPAFAVLLPLLLTVLFARKGREADA